MNIQPADYLVHFSNVLLLVAYSVRDILWLRWFAVAAALTNIPLLPLSAGETNATAGHEVLTEGKPVGSICIGVS